MGARRADLTELDPKGFGRDQDAPIDTIPGINYGSARAARPRETIPVAPRSLRMQRLHSRRSERMDSLVTPRIIIEPRSGWQMIDWNALWSYRELLGFLVWRDIQIRYKQTVLGVLWAVIQPVSTMLVFTIFFGRFGGMSHSVDGHYPIFVFAGLLPWQLFATAVGQAGQSLVNSSNLITKVYFPRLIIPVSSVGSAVVDFGVALLVMLALMAGWGIPFGPQMLAVPVFLAGTTLAAIGVGTLLSALVIE
ncbi:MAG: hypothetical protein EHM42_13695, partial [Planctomycetaceae bacterium]